jgi:hypothetical protein
VNASEAKQVAPKLAPRKNRRVRRLLGVQGLAAENAAREQSRLLGHGLSGISARFVRVRLALGEAHSLEPDVLECPATWTSHSIHSGLRLERGRPVGRVDHRTWVISPTAHLRLRASRLEFGPSLSRHQLPEPIETRLRRVGSGRNFDRRGAARNESDAGWHWIECDADGNSLRKADP